MILFAVAMAAPFTLISVVIAHPAPPETCKGFTHRNITAIKAALAAQNAKMCHRPKPLFSSSPNERKRAYSAAISTTNARLTQKS